MSFFKDIGLIQWALTPIRSTSSNIEKQIGDSLRTNSMFEVGLNSWVLKLT